MIIDEEVYLEHFGVKGMQWGVRRAQYKSRRASRNRSGKLTGRQRVGVGLGAYGIGSIASVIALKSGSLNFASIVGLPAMVVGGVMIRKRMLNKHGSKKLSELPAPKVNEEARLRVEALIKKNSASK